MKKTLITLALGTAAVASSFGQGYVGFFNGTASKVSVNSSVGGTSFAATPATANAYYYALFYAGPTVTTVLTSAAAVVAAAPVLSDANWTFDSGVLGASTARAGFMGDSTGGTQSAVSLAAGTTGEFVVVGWSANIGSTEQNLAEFLAGTDAGVSSGFVGESAVGSQTVSAGAPSPVGNIFGAAPQIPGFDLGGAISPSPEPTTIALGVMGAASLLAFRRKKA
jgi:hypothetical protein